MNATPAAFVQVLVIVALVAGISGIIFDEVKTSNNELLTLTESTEQQIEIPSSGEYIWVDGIRTPIEQIDTSIYDPTVKTEPNTIEKMEVVQNGDTVNSSIEAITEITSWLDLIALIVAASIIMYLVLHNSSILGRHGGY